MTRVNSALLYVSCVKIFGEEGRDRKGSIVQQSTAATLKWLWAWISKLIGHCGVFIEVQLGMILEDKLHFVIMPPLWRRIEAAYLSQDRWEAEAFEI